METFRKITSFAGKKKFLLKESGYKSINEAKRENDFDGTNEQMYEILKDRYNEIVEQLREEKKKLLNKQRKDSKAFLKGFNVEDNTIRQRVVPSKEDVRHFKKFTSEIRLVNPEPVPHGYTSLNILLNNSIPQIIQSLREIKGLKVVFTFGIYFLKEIVETDKFGKEHVIKTFKEIPHNTEPKIISNIDEIKPFIAETRAYMEQFIPEIENQGSGLIFEYVKYMVIHVVKYNPLKIKSYLPLPTHIANKRCCINVKNNDDKCLMYCVLYHFFQNEIVRDADRVTKYLPYLNHFDWSKIKFPVALKDIGKVEDLIECGINVYDQDKRPLHITSRKSENTIHLLVIGDHIKDTKVNHYVYIKNFNVFVMENVRDKNGVHRHNKSFICERCLHPFSSKERCEKHKRDGCDMFEPTKIELPKKRR